MLHRIKTNTYKAFIKRILLLLFTAIFSFSCFSPCLADNVSLSDSKWPTPPDIYAEAAIVIDAETGAVIYAKNADAKMYPASITKIVTAILAIKNSSIDDRVTISQDALDRLSWDAARIDPPAKLGEEIPFMDCLYGLILRSGNDLANALAEHAGGNFDNFITMMNKYASEVGATNTHFANPSGLHEDDHYTTARDFSLIVKEAVKNQVFCKVWGTGYYEMPATNKADMRRMWHRHSMLVKIRPEYYKKAVGGKTGTTDEAGSTLVTYAKDGDLSLICVMLKSNTTNIYKDTLALMEYGFNNFQKVRIDEQETRFMTNQEGFSENLGLMLGSRKPVLYMGSGNYAIISKDTKITEYGTKIDYLPEVQSTGIVGTISYMYKDYVLGKVPLYISGGNNEYVFGPAVNNEEDTEKKSTDALIINIEYIILGIILLLIISLLLVILRLTKEKRKEKRDRKRIFRESHRRRTGYGRRFR